MRKTPHFEREAPPVLLASGRGRGTEAGAEQEGGRGGQFSRRRPFLPCLLFAPTRCGTISAYLSGLATQCRPFGLSYLCISCYFRMLPLLSKPPPAPRSLGPRLPRPVRCGERGACAAFERAHSRSAAARAAIYRRFADKIHIQIKMHSRRQLAKLLTAVRQVQAMPQSSAAASVSVLQACD